jgi:H+/Cl- antiporter ClcA
MILGVLGGLLASLFIKLNIALNKFRRDRLAGRKLMRLFEALLVTTLTAALTFGLPMTRSCEPSSDIKYLPNVCDRGNSNATQPETIFCKVLINIILIRE